MMIQAMAEAGAEPGATVMVGDTTYDMMMARNAGALALAVTWGYHEKPELEASGAHAAVEEFGAIASAIGRLIASSGQRDRTDVSLEWRPWRV